MDLPDELSSPVLDAASESQLHDPKDSTTVLGPEVLQTASIRAQSEAPTSPQNPAQDRDSKFTEFLNDSQERVITSQFVGDIHITFDTQDENLRAQNKLLPKRFYRTFYETSATLSSYVTVDTHVKHRSRRNLKIDPRNAFQAIGEFSIRRGMGQETIKRHLVWNQKKVPSAYISVFNSLRYAKRRAGFHSETSQRIGQRVSVAGIRTNHLVPATIRGLYKSTISILTKVPLLDDYRVFGRTEKSKEYIKHVDIPVWIHKKAKEKYGSRITPKQWRESGADMWMSIIELRLSNILTVHPPLLGNKDTIKGKGHDYEWLCCGAIPQSLITSVWPWDGNRLYVKDPGHPIRSVKNSGQTWVWHWEKKMWLPDTFSAAETVTQAEQPGTKRQRTDDGGAREVAPCERCDNRPALSMSIIQSIIDMEPICPVLDEKPSELLLGYSPVYSSGCSSGYSPGYSPTYIRSAPPNSPIQSG